MERIKIIRDTIYITIDTISVNFAIVVSIGLVKTWSIPNDRPKKEGKKIEVQITRGWKLNSTQVSVMSYGKGPVDYSTLRSIIQQDQSLLKY